MKSLDEMKQMAHRNAGVVLISPRDLTLLCFIVGVCSVVVGSVLIIVAVGGAAGLFADAPAVNVHVHLEDPQKFDMVRAKERLSSSILTGIAKDPFCTLYSKKRSNLGAGRVWDARGDVNRESPRTAIHARGESVRVSDRTYHCTTEEQIAALCAIKALNNPANWPEVDPCQFTASPCEEFLDGVACCTDPTTNNSYVTALDLHATQLRGSIPEEIASLCALEYLDFSDNTLEDEMPMEVFELIHLTYIDIHENRLEGDIPPFARLSHLTFLDVHDNKLAGQIPDDFYTLPSLNYLDLSFNDLNSTIPASFASLDSLQYLDMSSATLTGTIPFSLGNDLDLIYLFLTSNRLTGQIPESFGNMPSLQYLRLNNNFLTGAIPQSIPAMSSLLSLDLSRNWMDGTIPEFRNTEKIFYIDLSSNGFSGEIPRSIANLSSLYLLDLSDNILDGQVSSPLSDYLQILPQCDVSGNCLLCETPFPCACNESWSEDGCDCMNIGGCFISSICYNAGEENSESPCHQVCNPNVSTLLWTPLNCPDISEGSTSNDDDVVWIILILCVLSVLILVSLASFALLYLRKQKNENQIAEDTRLLQSCSVNGPTFPVHRRNSQPDIFSRTPGDRRTSMALFPLEVIPKGNLTFGCGGIQAPVGKEITQSITLCNNGKWGVRFAVLAPPHDQNKFQTFFSRQSGFLRPKTHVVIDVKMTIFCTTVVDVQIQIIAQRDQSIRQERLFLPVLVETKLSTVLDYDELTIGTEIGEGTYGVVFVGFWRGQEVAIKILKEQVGTKTADMFSKEVSVLETIRCPQIVNFLGAVHTPGKLCMVFEYLKLGSVRECMKSHPFSLGLKLKCLLDCSRGMNFLHQSNLTHRDIKPDNLLMFSLDITASVNCKITDFGSTRAINLDRSTQQYTTKIGTPVYMAPELLQQGKYKQSADVYSYGILSWEIITESSAFSDLPTVWRITKHVVAGNRPPTDNLQPDIAEFLSHCWAQNPSDRPRFHHLITTLEALCPKYSNV